MNLQSVWWEEPEEVRGHLSTFTRNLYKKIAKQLWFDFPEGEEDKKKLLRVLAISQTGKNGDEE